MTISTMIHGYHRTFLKMENCTTSGKTSVIEECQFKDSKLNLTFRQFKGSDVAFV